ncbi:MAG: hypothetical protein IKL61_02235 [Clostridia bacterium]|nr:hypothetical protein [Clostridia bacterium]
MKLCRVKMKDNDLVFELDQQQFNSQFQESLYFLQSDLDDVKEDVISLANESIKKDILQREEIKRAVDALRGDIYQLNDKLENANRELTGVVLSNFDEVKNNTQQKTEVDLSAVLQKLDDIEKRLEKLEQVKEEKADNVDDRVYEMLEKLNSKLGVLMEENNRKILDVKEEMQSFKDNFTSIMAGENKDEDDIDDSFNSLTSELDSLSKLVKEQTLVEEQTPSAILDLSEEIANLANEVL